MSRKKLSRNAPCPCGSGKKYKHCCYGKDFEYEEDDEGSVFKSIPISPEMREILAEQHRKSVEKFGREPGPNDQLFFDMPHPEQIEHMTVEAMKKAGIDPAVLSISAEMDSTDPAIIYAFEKPGHHLRLRENRQARFRRQPASSL